MKLVDILARELKVWPYAIDLIYSESPFAHAYGWDKKVDQPQSVMKCEWQAAVDALKVESAPAWVGIGLPPVGTVCEISLKASVDHENTVDGHRYFQHDGEEVTIVAHHKIDESSSAAVYAVLKGFSYEYHSLCEGNFKPIRTPEQIAEDRANKAVYEMAELLKAKVGFGVNLAEMRALYDAGYRKQEAK